MTPRNLLFVLAGLVVGLIAAHQIPMHAQKSSPAAADAEAPAPIGTAGAPSPARAKVSLQDALHQPYDFPFRGPTPLDEVARRLSADLGGQVVLDIAAMQRLNLEKDDEVELELKGSRLKTGLKLLLDQVGLTYRIIPEDDLMILTDPQGSEDPLERIWAELSDVHREVHDIQDMLDELLDLVESEEGGPRLRQPTILEEMPGAPGADPADPGLDPVPNDQNPEALTPERPRTRL